VKGGILTNLSMTSDRPCQPPNPKNPNAVKMQDDKRAPQKTVPSVSWAILSNLEFQITSHQVVPYT